MIASANSTEEPASIVGTTAAAYVRMSTEHQQYSLSNQMDVIREYAARRRLEIVKIFSDEGKSGLSIQGRDQLARLIEEVGNNPQFSCILVYDVSRWGRFQDADESAYYEYLCRRAGITVHYCAEQFENDGSPVSTIVKSVKRAMAGEYSRELSSKVFKGACRLIQLGYKQGGMAGYGLRRLLVDQNGNPKAQLQIGEQKSLQTDRVILVGGPPAERANVKWMYEAFVRSGMGEAQIAVELNRRGLVTDLGRPWTRATVHQVLTNEKYIGNNVYHRTSFKLKKRHVANPPEKWVRADGAFEAIVSPEMFSAARQIILARSVRLTNEQMLGKLREVLEAHGRVCGILIDEREGMPSTSAYRQRFGSLIAAYRLIGYAPEVDYGFIEANRRLRRLHPQVIDSVVSQIEALGGHLKLDPGTDLFCLNHEIWVSIVLCRHISTGRGSSRWVIRLDAGMRPDITVAVRMEEGNESIRDYYVLPAIDIDSRRMRLADVNGVYLDAYRFDTLDRFFAMAQRAAIRSYEN